MAFSSAFFANPLFDPMPIFNIAYITVQLQTFLSHSAQAPIQLQKRGGGHGSGRITLALCK